MTPMIWASVESLKQLAYGAERMLRIELSVQELWSFAHQPLSLSVDSCLRRYSVVLIARPLIFGI